MQHKTDLYFEAHVTIDPVTAPALISWLPKLAQEYGFRVSEFLYKKTGAVAKPDEFLTSRNQSYEDICERTINFVEVLQHNNYTVQRYKIENTLLDVRL